MADIRPRGDRAKVRFVDAFLNAITKAIYEPKRVDQQYRSATPIRRPTYIPGWRNIVGGAKWTEPANRRAHKKWMKRVKAERRALGDYDAMRHEVGIGQWRHHRSARTLRREAERRHALGWA